MKHAGSWSPFMFLVAVLLVVCEYTSAAADQINQTNQSNQTGLTVRGGAIVFDNPDFGKQTLLEFPFVLTRNEFEFFRPDSTDSNWYARIFAQVRLLKYDGKAVDSSNIYFSSRVATLAEARLSGIRLFNNVSLLVDPGVYSARLTVIDVVSKRQATVFYERIVMDPPSQEKLHLGGTCLAYKITYVGDDKASENDRQVKNGFRVLVNPLRVYSDRATSLYFYGELYNLRYDKTQAGSYSVSYAIFDDKKSIVRDYGFKTKEKPGLSAVMAEELDIGGWKEGDYTLRVIASDNSSERSDTVRLGFKIVTPGTSYLFSSASRGSDPYDTLSIDVKVNLAKYILSPAETQTLQRLDDDARERFLTQFWQERDPNPKTRLNEYRAEQIQRYVFANKNYSTNRLKDNGWLTDRGRIYMTYGPWERRKYVDLPQKADPFEVWYYYSLKEGAVFVFEDQEAFFDKTLIHSNVDGELYNAKWDKTLKDLDLLEDF